MTFNTSQSTKQTVRQIPLEDVVKAINYIETRQPDYEKDKKITDLLAKVQSEDWSVLPKLAEAIIVFLGKKTDTVIPHTEVIQSQPELRITAVEHNNHILKRKFLLREHISHLLHNGFFWTKT